MKENKLRDLINCGQFSVSTRIWSTDPFFYEACGQSGNFDYVEFVAEYAPYDFKDLPNIVRACELNGMGSMIKLDWIPRRSAVHSSWATCPHTPTTCPS